MAEHGKGPSIPVWHGLGFDKITQSEPAEPSKQDDNGVKLVDRREGKEGASHHEVTLTKSSSRHGLARAIQAVEDTMLREEAPVGLPTQALHPEDHAIHLAKAHETLMSLSEQRHDGNPEDGHAFGLNNSNGKGHGQDGRNGQGNGNAFRLDGNSHGSSGTGTAMVVSPPAVFTGAGDAVRDGSTSGNVNGYELLK